MQLIEFGTIMNMAKGKKPANQSQVKKDGFMPYVDIKAFETNTIENYADGVKCLPCNEGDILIVCDGSRSGLVGKAINGYVGSTLAKITADGITQNYLYYFLQGKYALLNTQKKGTGTPHLNPDLLKKQKLIVPSLPEQERIVTRIEELFSELDKAVETLQTTKQQLTVYRQAVLKEAFFQEISQEETIESVCSTIKVGIVVKPTQYYVDQGGVFAFRNANVRRGFVEDSDWAMISQNGHDLNKKSEVHTDDVLIARSGANLGMATVVPSKYDGYNAIDIVIAVPNKEKILPQYLAMYTNSPLGIDSIKKKQSGSAQGHINVSAYSHLLIPLPTIENQQQCVANIESRLSVCESIEQIVDTALAQADVMRQSILKQAFEGGMV